MSASLSSENQNYVGDIGKDLSIAEADFRYYNEQEWRTGVGGFSDRADVTYVTIHSTNRLRRIEIYMGRIGRFRFGPIAPSSRP